MGLVAAPGLSLGAPGLSLGVGLAATLCRGAQSIDSRVLAQWLCCRDFVDPQHAEASRTKD